MILGLTDKRYASIIDNPQSVIKILGVDKCIFVTNNTGFDPIKSDDARQYFQINPDDP